MSDRIEENREEPLRLFGVRSSPEGYTLRDFLYRSHIPFEWTDLTSDKEARQSANVDNLQDARPLPVSIGNPIILRRA